MERLRGAGFRRIAPTHFGFYDDPAWQLSAVEKALDESERWLETAMAMNPSLDDLRGEFIKWMDAQAREQSLAPDVIAAYDLANPLGMSADGMFRYWKKVRLAG